MGERRSDTVVSSAAAPANRPTAVALASVPATPVARRAPVIDVVRRSPAAPTPAAPVPWNGTCSATLPWPAGVPTLEDGLQMLTGRVGIPPALAKTTGLLAQGFSQDARAALAEATPYDATAIRYALACQWRMVVAMSLASSSPPTALDKPALEAMYTESDRAFEGLRTLEATRPEARRSSAIVRMSLASIAVDFSEFAQRLSVESGRPEPPTVVRKHTVEDRARVLAIVSVDEEVERKARRKQMALVAAFVVCVLAAGAYHAVSFFSRPSLPPPPSWAPAGMSAIPGPADGPQILLTSDGRPLAPQQLEAMKANVEGLGKKVVEAGAGQYLVISR